MNEKSYTYINLLLNQRRYVEAENLIVDQLSQDVDSSSLRYMLAIVKIRNNKLDDAEELLNGLLSDHYDPDYIFYLGEINSLRENYSLAEIKFREAIHADPENDQYYSGLSQNLYLQKKFMKAVEIADQGLELNPENIDLVNIRASCLVKLGKQDKAYESLDKTLAIDPENSYTHTTYAWSLLHQGKNKEALKHFQISLSIDPHSAYAQQGILEAMKSKFWIYRNFLRVMLWMSKFTGGKQWAIIIGAYLFARVLQYLSKTIPALAPFLIPVIVIMVVLFLSTWIIGPLFNLYLLTNPFGRLTLDQDDKIMAQCTGAALAAAIVFGLLYLITSIPTLLFGTIGFGLLMIPAGSMRSPRKDKNKKTLVLYSIGLLILLLLGIVTGYFSSEPINIFFTLAAIGLFIYQWVANALIIR